MTDRGAGEEKMTHEVTMDSIIDPIAGEESPMCNALSKDGHKCIWPTFKHPEYHESASHLARVGGEGPLEPAITTWPFIREEQGTFACPICGVATPHEHTGEEIAKFRSRRKEKTEPIPEERAGREAISQIAGELAEAIVIIQGFLTMPAMTLDQRKECIDDARKFLKTIFG